MEDTSLSSGKPAQNVNNGSIMPEPTFGKFRPVSPSPRALLTLLSVAVIFLIVVFFIVEGGSQKNTAYGTRIFLPFDTSLLLVNNNPAKNKAYDFLILAAKAKDPKQKSTDFVKAYILLSTAYQASPEASLRVQISKFFDFLKNSYPDAVKKNGLGVPCLEQSCGTSFRYNDQLTQIANEIAALSIGKEYAQSMKSGLESAAQANAKGDKQAVYNSLDSVVVVIKNYKVKGQPELVALLGSVTDYLKTLDPNRFSVESKLKFYSLN